MTPFSIPSPFLKILVVAALLVLIVPLLFSFWVNHWFSRNESSILATLNENFPVPVQIDRIRYSLIEGIAAEGVTFPAEDNLFPDLPLQVKSVHIHPSFMIFPHPGIRLGTLVFEAPSLTVRAGLSDVEKIRRLLRDLPTFEKRLGPFYFSTQVTSLRILKGKVTLVSSSSHPWRQELEDIRFFLGRKLWGGERLEFEGHIAGNPKASFRIRANVKTVSPDAADMDLIVDCRQIATAYLRPYLEQAVELPDEAMTAFVRFKIRKGKAFASKGKLSFQGPAAGEKMMPQLLSLISSSLRYDVRGEFDGGSVHLKKLALKTSGISLKGGGEIRISPKASAYRISLASRKTAVRKFAKLFPDLQIGSGNVQLFFALTGSSKRFFPHLDVILEDCGFYDKKLKLFWSKVDGRLRVSNNQIRVDEIWAFVNDFPVRMRGMFLRAERSRLELELSTYPGQFSILRRRNPLNAAARFIGEYDGKSWNGDLWVTHFLYGSQKEETQWKLALHGLTMEGSHPERFIRDFFEGKKVGAESLSVRCEGPKKPLDHLAMRGASFFISAEKGRIQCDLLEGPFARGKLFLQSWAEFRHFPDVSSTINGSLTDADVTVLLERLGKRYPITGRISAEGTWSCQKNAAQLVGRFRLADGSMGPSVPLQRLADETGIEPLRQIQFREFSGQVAFREGDLDLNNLRLLSDQAELFTNIKIREEHLSGSLSAKFPVSSVRKSSDLRGLLRYVGEKKDVRFDFKVAGSLGVPRIQWLSGAFKRKVETKLAPWMRKRLAQEMGKILSERKEREETE